MGDYQRGGQRMKKRWEYKTLKEACIQLFAGGDVPTPYVSKIKTKEFSVPIYSNSVENEGLYGYTNSARVNEQAVTISARGTIGATFRRYEPFYPAIRLITAVPNKEILSIDYLFYALKILTIGNSGTSIPQLTIPNIKNISIPLPPLSEQKEIVEYLDSSFAKIDKLKENAAKNLEEAKALFQSALKDALEPKEGWEEKTMDEIVDINTPISYGIVQPGDDVPNGIPVVRPVDLTAKNISLNENIKRTAKENSESYKRTILNGKEILMCVRGTTGIVSLTDATLKNCNVTRGIVPLKITEETLRLFVYYTIIAPVASEYIQHNTKGAALKQINIADVKKIPVALPSPQEQQSIVSFLDSLSEKVNTLQQNYSRICDECDALKQAILRQVFE